MCRMNRSNRDSFNSTTKRNRLTTFNHTMWCRRELCKIEFLCFEWKKYRGNDDSNALLHWIWAQIRPYWNLNHVFLINIPDLNAFTLHFISIPISVLIGASETGPNPKRKLDSSPKSEISREKVRTCARSPKVFFGSGGFYINHYFTYGYSILWWMKLNE